jgi:hypothetical protein
MQFSITALEPTPSMEIPRDFSDLHISQLLAQIKPEARAAMQASKWLNTEQFSRFTTLFGPSEHTPCIANDPKQAQSDIEMIPPALCFLSCKSNISNVRTRFMFTKMRIL